MWIMCWMLCLVAVLCLLRVNWWGLGKVGRLLECFSLECCRSIRIILLCIIMIFWRFRECRRILKVNIKICRIGFTQNVVFDWSFLSLVFPSVNIIRCFHKQCNYVFGFDMARDLPWHGCSSYSEKQKGYRLQKRFILTLAFEKSFHNIYGRIHSYGNHFDITSDTRRLPLFLLIFFCPFSHFYSHHKYFYTYQGNLVIAYGFQQRYKQITPLFLLSSGVLLIYYAVCAFALDGDPEL